ncbi:MULTISPECIES: hypothetical protein [unclassified Oceanobacter]|jgi:hypothetical protein|uniref:hypothetical protein n=1 Tax=unclassified Oceanobacter TaxID=2620260 RepID=UPI0026E255A2|nr:MULTISPECIES: hypothetical protein [unclassified Oceanobacter]MDO6682597.1 hypothetical protein [Oceanobacter sp. 5_MG-2023]MDP2506813.1 hypothetical protein [Oceanobacter sp. 3_MG-2023]
MTIVLSVLIVFLLAGTLGALLYLTQNAAGKSRRQLAPHLEAEYQGYAALDRELRAAGFELFHQSQIRHGRHQLRGDWQQRAYKIFDYPMITAHGISQQTLLLIECKHQHVGRFRASPYNPGAYSRDQFVDPMPDRCIPLASAELPPTLQQWKISAIKPHAIRIKLNGDLCQWLEQHDSINIELSDGFLLIYRPDSILEAESISPALNKARELVSILES